MSVTSNRAWFCIGQLDRADGPVADNDVALIADLLGDTPTHRAGPVVATDNVGAALRMVQRRFGFASVAYHVDGTIDCWVGSWAGDPRNSYAFGRDAAPNIVLRAGLTHLLKTDAEVEAAR